MADISDIAVSFQRIRVNLGVLVGTDDRAMQKEMQDGIKKISDNIDKKIAVFEKSLQTDEELRIFAELNTRRADFSKGIDKVYARMISFKMQSASALLQSEWRAVEDEYRKSIDKLVEIKNTQAKQVDEANGKLAHNATVLMYALMGAAFVVSIGLGLLITSNVMGQLGEDPAYLHEVSSRIAGGDLDVAFRAHKKKRGVYAVMQGMVATMKTKIAEANEKSAQAAEQARLANLATGEAEEAKTKAERAKAEGMLQAAHQLEGVVEAVSSASEELSAQIEQSSRGSQEQAHRVGETAAAVEEMNATVLEVAKNAAQASETADGAKHKAQEGYRVVSRVVSGIGEVQTLASGMKTDMTTLGKQAEGIGQILNVISDIADQTNLLALNAAIEAARAGEAGRGFAVVADEVRKLAEKTMTATKEVGDAIRGIQDGTKQNIANVEHVVSKIGEATKLASESGEALNGIVTLVDATTDQVRSIATASEQQSAASEEINHSVEDINRISTETSNAMRQSAQAVEDLAHQAQVLKRLVDQMKDEGGDGSSGMPATS